MKIKVYGSGCSTCKKLYELVKKVIIDRKIEAELEYLTDVQAMIDRGFIQSPALVIDDHPVLAGYVPNEEQLIEFIEQSKKVDTKDNRKSCCGAH